MLSDLRERGIDAGDLVFALTKWDLDLVTDDGFAGWLWLDGAEQPAARLTASGMARFVEESYRAEPQTLIVGGLRLYQWLAIGSLRRGSSARYSRPSREHPALRPRRPLGSARPSGWRS